LFEHGANGVCVEPLDGSEEARDFGDGARGVDFPEVGDEAGDEDDDGEVEKEDVGSSGGGKGDQDLYSTDDGEFAAGAPEGIFGKVQYGDENSPPDSDFENGEVVCLPLQYLDQFL
jgi:hypothetical protein